MSKQTELVQSVVELGRSAFALKCDLVKMGAHDARAIATEARDILAKDCEEAADVIDEMLDLKEEG